MNFKNPQYKKKPFGLLVIVVVIIMLILLIFVIRSCNHHENSTNNTVEEITTQEIRVTEHSTSTVDLEDNTQQKHIGVSLKDMTVSESDGYYTDEESTMDSVGNNYSNNFTTLGTTGVLGNGTSYATFYLGGRYNYLIGKLAVNNSSWDEHTASFSIYCDDNEVYNTGEVSKQFAPTDISVNIENCQWLKIMVNNFAGSDGEYINFILSDFYFSKSNEDLQTQTLSENSNNVKDTYLKNMNATESDGYYPDSNSAKDPHGNAYDNHVVTIGTVGVLGNGTSYATFYLGKKYKSLTGKIAVNSTSWDNKVASFVIYSDDNEIYNTGDVGKEFNPIDLSLILEDCEWLKIYVDNNDGDWGENINFILSEFKLHT